MKLRLFFAWHDLWVGAYWSKASRTLYVCFLPMLAIAIKFVTKLEKET